MKKIETLAQFAKIIGRELEGTGPSTETFALVRKIAKSRKIIDILEAIIKYSESKNKNKNLINGYAFLLYQSLDTLRIDRNGGEAQAETLIDAVRQRASMAAQDARISNAIIMIISHAFAAAQLDPGRILKDCMVETLVNDNPSDPQSQKHEILDHLQNLADTFDNEPFSIYTELLNTTAILPPEYRAGLAGSFASSDIPSIRDAALGFVLDNDREVSATVLSIIANPTNNSIVSHTTIDRLVRMRSWVNEARRSEIDAAIKSLRPRASAPLALKRSEIRLVLSTMIDGVGAQSYFIFVRRGSEMLMASVLIKIEEGVTEAWVRDGLSRFESENIQERIMMEAFAFDVSIEMFERNLSNALAINLNRNTPPPFGLVQTLETIGLGLLQPHLMLPSDLIDELFADLSPDILTPKFIARARRASEDWIGNFEVVETWFEAGPHVDEILRPIKTRRNQIHIILNEYLQNRLTNWATIFVLTAYLLKEANEEGLSDWIDFAIVARDFLANESIDRLPIAKLIAERTVDSFIAKSR